MAQNDYQTFGDSGVDGVNKLSLANYTADNDRVYGNGYTTKVIRSQLHNKALQQTSKMSAALAQFLVNNGQDALDTDSFSTLATKLGSVYNKFGGAISAAVTLTAAQSGGRFTVAAATVAYNITLPTASAGLNFEFEGINGAFAVGLTYADTLYLPDGTTVAAGTFSQINLGAIGNTIKIWSDGTNWFMTTLGQTIVKNGVLNNQAVNLGQVLPTAAISNFKAYQSTGQSIAANTGTAIIFQTKVFDDLVEYDVATGKFMAKVAGTYIFTCGIYGGQTSTAVRYSIIYVNGVAKCRLHESAADNGTKTMAGTSIPLKLNAGDYVQVYYATSIAETTGNGITDLQSLEQIIYFGGYRIK